MMCAMFECLPSSIVSSVLTEWTDVKDLVSLDSACSRADIRQELLDLMCSPTNTFAPTDALYKPDNDAIRWIIRRSMKVSFVKLCGGDLSGDRNLLKAFLRISGHSLTEIAFHSDPHPAVALELVVVRCPNVTKLRFLDCPLYTATSLLLAKLAKLELLTVTPTRSKHPSLELMAACTGGLFQIPALRSLRLSTGSDEVTHRPRTNTYHARKSQVTSNIVHLELHNFSANIVSLLECCPHLRALSLPNTDMPDNVHEIARCCPAVAHLSINGFWVGGGTSSLVTLFQRLPLQTLCIDHTHLSDTAIRGICAMSNTLQELYMVDTTGHSDIVVYMEVFKQCTKLHTLCISSGDFFDLFINSEGDTCMSMHCITTLILHLTKSGSDSSAIGVVNLLCPNITKLYLTYVDDGIVDELVGWVANCAHFRALHVLEIRDKHFNVLKKRLPHLTVFVNPHDAKYRYDAMSYVV